MFASETQQARVCEMICRAVRLDGMWTEQGPSRLAVSLLIRNGGPLSTGERIMFLCAWGIWNGRGTVNLGDVVHRLDNRNLALLGSLMVALAGVPDAVDRWLADQERAFSPTPTSPVGASHASPSTRKQAKAGQ